MRANVRVHTCEHVFSSENSRSSNVGDGVCENKCQAGERLGLKALAGRPMTRRVEDAQNWQGVCCARKYLQR